MEMSHTQFKSELLKLANTIDETVKALKEIPAESKMEKVAASADSFNFGTLSDRPTYASNPLLDFLQS